MTTSDSTDPNEPALHFARPNRQKETMIQGSTSHVGRAWNKLSIPRLVVSIRREVIDSEASDDFLTLVEIPQLTQRKRDACGLLYFRVASNFSSLRAVTRVRPGTKRSTEAKTCENGRA